MNVPDNKLIEAWAAQRHADAFVEIAARHAGMVYGVCRRMLGDADSIEETARICFLEVARAQRPPKGSFVPWLHALAVEKAARAREISGIPQRTEQRRSQETRWDDVRSRIDAAIAALPSKWSEPLILRFLEGQPAVTAAQALGLARETIDQRIEKGIEQLRRALEAQGFPVSSSGLTAALAANAVEACPAALTSALARLAMVGDETAPPLEAFADSPADTRLKSRAGLWIGLCVLAALPVFALLLFNRPAEAPTPPPIAPTPAPINPSPPPVPSKPAVEPPAPAASPEEETPPVEALSVRDALVQVLLNKFEAEKIAGQAYHIPLSSKDLPLDNALHFFFVAIELLPETAPGWLEAKWNEALSQETQDDSEMRNYLEACQEPFAAVFEGLKVQNALLPPPRGPGEPRPYLDGFQELARAMGLSLLFQAADPASEHLVANGLGMLEFAWESCRGGMIENGVAALDMGEQAMRALRYAMTAGNIKPEECRDATDQVHKLETRAPVLWEMASAEAQMIHEWAQAWFPDAQALRRAILETYPGGEMDDTLSETPDKTILDTLRELTRSQADIAYLAAPYAPNQQTQQGVGSTNPAMIALTTPAFIHLPAREASAHAALRAGMLIAAVEWFGMENGQYPAALEDLVPAYLGVLPRNPLMGPGAGFTYELSETGYAIHTSSAASRPGPGQN